MRWRNIITRPNIIRLSYIVIVVGFILFMNFMLIKKIYEENVSKRIELQCKQLNSRLSASAYEIEQLAQLMVNNGVEVDFESKKTDYINLYNGIKEIEIAPVVDQSKGWHYSISPNTGNICFSYQTETNNGQALLFTLKDDWVVSHFDQLIFEPTTNVFFFDAGFNYLWKAGETSSERNFTSYINQKFVSKVLLAQPEHPNGLSNYILDVSKRNDTYLFYLIKNQVLNTFIIYHHPHGVFNNYLVIYFRNLSFIIIFFLLVFLVVDLRSDYLSRKPYESIINTLKRSKYIQLPAPQMQNHAAYIERSIDMLHNQLEQYKTGLEKTKLQQQKIANDLKLAKKLQENLQVKDNTNINQNPNVKIHAISEAAFEVGGDFYDYFLIDSDHLLFTIADVAGKGIPASLFMIYSQTLLRSISHGCYNVAEITENLNNRLLEEKVSDLFITIFIGILNIKNGKLSYCNAAHNCPMLIKSRGTIEELTDVHGIPVGIYPNRKYKSSTIELDPNDQLFLFTDGLTDSHDENNVSFSVDVVKYNLMGAWFQEPKEVVDKIKDCVTTFRGNNKAEDDMTIMCVKLLEA